jgi:hypothetical protein
MSTSPFLFYGTVIECQHRCGAVFEPSNYSVYQSAF